MDHSDKLAVPLFDILLPAVLCQRHDLCTAHTHSLGSDQQGWHRMDSCDYYARVRFRTMHAARSPPLQQHARFLCAARVSTQRRRQSTVTWRVDVNSCAVV